MTVCWPAFSSGDEDSLTWSQFNFHGIARVRDCCNVEAFKTGRGARAECRSRETWGAADGGVAWRVLDDRAVTVKAG